MQRVSCKETYSQSEEPPEFGDVYPVSCKQYRPVNGYLARRAMNRILLALFLMLLLIGVGTLWVRARVGSGGPVPMVSTGEEGPGARDGAPPGLTLRDVAGEAGVVLRNLCGHPEKRFIIEANGSGAALFDYDLDGDLDIYIVNGSSIAILRGEAEPVRNTLYRNEGGWRFVDVTESAGAGDTGWGYGCAVGDIDDDGDPDLYVTNFGPNLLYENLGDGTFREIAREAGVADDGWGESAGFGDIDNDGDLDLYVTNNIVFDIDNLPNGGRPCLFHGIPFFCGPTGLPAQPDRLYRNKGGRKFEDISESSGIRDPDPQYGLGVVFGDYDDDGWVDIYVANDSVANFLFHNLGDGRFEEVGVASGTALGSEGEVQAGMGTDFGDYDGDGRADIFVTNFHDDHDTLYWNAGEGLFMDVSESHGLKYETWRQLGWGTAFVDIDNDGDEDLYIANGHISPVVDGAPLDTSYLQPDQLFVNLGGGEYREESERIVISGSPRCSRGAAFGDLDDDGDVDILVVEIDAPPTLLENRGGNRNGWLWVRLVGVQSCPDGEGAKVSVKVSGKVQRKEATRSGSYCSSSDGRVHFGIGKASRVDEMEVRWPSGKVQVFQEIPANREVTIHEEAGILAE